MSSDGSVSCMSIPSIVFELREPALSKDEVLVMYAEWVEKSGYDSEVLSCGYEAPALTVQYLSESFPKDTRDEKKIIDIGAGTGLVARGLRAGGFRHIDALDPSEAMLSIAKKKGLYENYFCEFMTDKPLPIEADTYDGITASGCFTPNHIRPDALHEMIRIVKPGGIIVIITRASILTTSEEYKNLVFSTIDGLERDGKWKKLVDMAIGCYHQGEDAIIWKFQVLEQSKH